MRSTKGVRCAVSLFAAACLLVAACGGSDDSSESSATEPSAVTDPQGSESDGSGGPEPSDPAGEADRSLVLEAQDTTFNVLDPVTEINVTTLSAMSLIYDNLIRTTHDNQAVPGLAESWSSPDPQTFVMVLRAGVGFQDGTPFDGHAVAAHIERGQTAPRSALAGPLSPIERVEVSADGLTVTLHLSEPSAGLMPGVFAGMAGLVPSPTAVAADPEDYGLDTAVGAGAYEVGSFKPKELLQLTSWEGYWDADNRMFAGINLHTVQSDQVTPGLVSQGQLDIGFAKDGQFEQLEATPGIEYEVSPTGQFTEIFINYGVAPWDDVRVRQALQFAVDRDLLAEAMTGNTAEPASQPVPPSSWAYNPDVAGRYPYDPDQAKALLADAGFPNGLSVDIGMIDYDYYRPLAEAVQDMLKDSGFDVTLVPIPPSGVQQALYQDQTVSAAVSAFAPPSATDPGQTLQQKFGTDGAFNPSHVTIEGLDEALADGAATTDQATRAEAYRQVVAIAMDQALSVPLYYNAGITMYGPRVRNLTVGEQPSRAANWTSEPRVFLTEG